AGVIKAETLLILRAADSFCAQLMDAHLGAYALRNVAKMLVVREIDNLPFRCHPGEQAKGFFRTKIVEGLHDVVRDERDRRTRSCKLMVAGNPQSEIELEARTL